MSEVKINTEQGKEEEEDVSYTLRGIPADVHKAVLSFQREISYKRERKFNLEQTYTEALIEWAASRELQKTV